MKNKNIYGVAIIPAKTDSTRLRKKNLQMVAGKTLLEENDKVKVYCDVDNAIDVNLSILTGVS